MDDINYRQPGLIYRFKLIILIRCLCW